MNTDSEIERHYIKNEFPVSLADIKIEPHDVKVEAETDNDSCSNSPSFSPGNVTSVKSAVEEIDVKEDTSFHSLVCNQEAYYSVCSISCLKNTPQDKKLKIKTERQQYVHSLMCEQESYCSPCDVTFTSNLPEVKVETPTQNYGNNLEVKQFHREEDGSSFQGFYNAECNKFLVFIPSSSLLFHKFSENSRRQMELTAQQNTTVVCTLKSNGLLKCSICYKSFTKINCYNKHVLMHQTEKPKFFPCETCNKTFRTKSELNSHIVIHSDEKPFTCSTCNKSFRRKGDLISHIHRNDKPFKCEACNLLFRRRSNLRNHLLIHQNVKPYKCELCSKSFRRKEHLTAHKLTHAHEKTYTCELCDVSFRIKKYLTVHMRSHVTNANVM